jgi:hypothetical protein
MKVKPVPEYSDIFMTSTELGENMVKWSEYMPAYLTYYRIYNFYTGCVLHIFMLCVDGGRVLYTLEHY